MAAAPLAQAAAKASAARRPLSAPEPALGPVGLIANAPPSSPGRAPRVLGRALRLVWETSPRWTVATALVLLAEGTVPLLVLWCVKLLVDEVAAGIAAGTLGTDRVLPLVGALLLLALAEAGSA